MRIPKKKLNSRAKIPVIGFGTGMLKGVELRKSLDWAYEAGYRHIDTADYYNNHEIIGKFLSSPEVKRDDIFITTKVWKNDLAEEDVKRVLKSSLEDLKTDYVDLYLIHAPNDEVSISETLEAMRDLQDEGLINAVGISNFNRFQVDQVLMAQKSWKTDFKVTNHQIEYNPSHNPEQLRRFCFDNDITVTAYSPLNQGEDLDHKMIMGLKEKYDKSSAQLILRWLVQRGLIAIPSSTKYDHIKENIDIFDWELEESDINKIDSESRIVGVVGTK